MLSSLARACYRHPWKVILAWLIGMFVLSGVAWGAIGSNFRTDFKPPASETKDVFDFLSQASPEDAGFVGQVVFTSPDGVNTPAVQAAVAAMAEKVRAHDGVRVTTPFDSPQQAFQISSSGTIGYAQLDITERPLTEFVALADEIQAEGNQALADASVPGLRFEYGGDIFHKFTMPASEALGVLAAVIILLIAFGSVLAMGLPIGSALAGLMTGAALVAIASHAFSMPDFTMAFAAMIGLGVGIDYALFIVTRYREGLEAGLQPEAATVDSLDSAGRAVLFAGLTVIISLCGLFIIGLSFVRGIAVACIVTVLSMILTSLTLLPALLGKVRERIDVTTWRGLLGLLVPVLLLIPALLLGSSPLALAGVAFGVLVVLASLVVPALRRQIPTRTARRREDTFWYRWSRFVQRRPWTALIGGLVPLLVLAVPMFSLRLGFSDQGNYPEKETTRKAYDLLAEGFGPGFNGPLLVLVQNGDEAGVNRLVDALNQTEGVVRATPTPVSLGPGNALISLIPTSSPQDRETTQLVHRLREDVIPASGVSAKVGGFPALNVDFSDYLGTRLPYIIGSVLVLSFLLLMVVFRSLLVPLKAVIMNLLSIGAAYGVVVAIFQWGWLKSIVGIDKTGPIESWVPMFLFAIVFGLSMDYEVFLLSRMKEEFDRTGDNAGAVADGLAVTARVITAAALIMVCVFAAFVIGDERQLKLFGLGMAVAVLVDATIVRMVLVPATMELLGARNWWLPKSLDRILPRVQIEGQAHRSDHAPDREMAGAGRK